MKYILTFFLSVFSFLGYSQNSDSLLYVRCRNFQSISDSSLTVTILSKTEVKIWKDTTHKNTLFIEPKEEGNIKIALTNSENDTVQIMNYKAVLLPLPKIKLSEYMNRQKPFSISLKKGGQIVIIDAIPTNKKKVIYTIDKMSDLRYSAVNSYTAYLKRGEKEIDSVSSKKLGYYFQLNTTPLMKKAKKGDTILFKVLGVKRMNYEEEIKDIPLNIEFEYPILV